LGGKRLNVLTVAMASSTFGMKPSGQLSRSCIKVSNCARNVYIQNIHGSAIGQEGSLFGKRTHTLAAGKTQVFLLSKKNSVVTRMSPVCAASQSDYRSKSPSDVRVLVVGATGYIGKYVVQELVKRGYQVVAFCREKSGIGGKQTMEDTKDAFKGAEVVFGDVTNMDSLSKVGFEKPVDVVVSCLASRTGGIKDSNLIDYQATANAMNAGRKNGAQHFVLLSAICVQKPLLEFQRAKLKFEKELQEVGDMTYSIVRPTAFFKSLAGQVQLVKEGKPYVFFGDGKLAACKPISERDLASFIADCVQKDEYKNKVLPIGGPGEALTALDQANMLFRITGKKPWYFPVPVALMDGIIGIFDGLASIFPQLEDSAEFAKIGKYYAVESMLVWDPKTGEYSADQTPSYGTDTLEDFFKSAVKEGGLQGQELGDAAVFGVNKE
jgi:divinyl chlorophyllide a 8-vinyl-reductase